MSGTLPALAGRAPADLVAWGKNAIEQAASFIAVKEIRDQAEALRAYQRSVGAAQDAVDAAQEIRIRAERRMGQEIGRAQREGSAATPHRREKGSEAATLSELGVTKQQSSDWQQLAAVSQWTFDAALNAAKGDGKLSLSAVRKSLSAHRSKAQRPPKVKPRRTVRKPPSLPTPEDPGQQKVLSLYFAINNMAQIIADVGEPGEVAERSEKTLKHSGPPRFDPQAIYRITKFLTSLAEAVEAREGGR